MILISINNVVTIIMYMKSVHIDNGCTIFVHCTSLFVTHRV